MKVVLAQARWMVLELLRQPAYVIPTLSFPALFFGIFAVPESTSVEAANMMMASFSCFAVFGVVFLQFGVGTAQERSTSWFRYLKTLPVKGWQLIFARTLSGLFFSILAVAVIVAVARLSTPMQLTSQQWLQFFVCLMLGGLTFSTMGFALGYWATEKAALPLGNMIYLPLSFVGGLWKPPTILPEWVQTISNWLPTRYYGEWAWASVSGAQVQGKWLAVLVTYLIVFGVIALLGNYKDRKMGWR